MNHENEVNPSDPCKIITYNLINHHLNINKWRWFVESSNNLSLQIFRHVVSDEILLKTGQSESDCHWQLTFFIWSEIMVIKPVNFGYNWLGIFIEDENMNTCRVSIETTCHRCSHQMNEGLMRVLQSLIPKRFKQLFLFQSNFLESNKSDSPVESCNYVYHPSGTIWGFVLMGMKMKIVFRADRPELLIDTMNHENEAKG